jgi:hypothetical protein
LKVEHIHEAVRSGEMVDYCDVGVTHAEIPGLLLHPGGSGGGEEDLFSLAELGDRDSQLTRYVCLSGSSSFIRPPGR